MTDAQRVDYFDVECESLNTPAGRAEPINHDISRSTQIDKHTLLIQDPSFLELSIQLPTTSIPKDDVADSIMAKKNVSSRHAGNWMDALSIKHFSTKLA